MAVDFEVTESTPDKRPDGLLIPDMRLVRINFRPLLNSPIHSNVFHMQLYPTGSRLLVDDQGRAVTEGGKLVKPDEMGVFPANPLDPYRRENFLRNNDAEMVANIEAYINRKRKAADEGKPYPQHHNTTLNLQVAASADDAFHRGGDHSLFTSSTSFPVGNNASSGDFTLFDASARLTGVAIPTGATIDAATMTLTPKSADSGTTVRSNIRAHLNANSGQISNETAWHNDFVDSGLTVALVAWDSLPAWTIDVEEASPDFKAVIQEVVDLGGWASGNALHVFWLNDGSDLGSGIRRAAHSYDSDTAKAPKLDIDYTSAVAEFPLPVHNFGVVAPARGGKAY